MAYQITQTCTSCGYCEPHCPVDAISEGPLIYVIDPGLCCDCEGYSRTPLCIKYCPVTGCIQKIES